MTPYSMTTRAPTAVKVVAVIGEAAEGGLRDSVAAGFRGAGCEVEVIDSGPWSPGWLAAAAFRRPALALRFRRSLLQRVDVLSRRVAVDLVVVIKGAFLDPPTIEKIRGRLGAPVICWNPDSPFDRTVSNAGAGIPRAVGAYDVYVTWAEDIAYRLAKVAVGVVVLPFAWDPDVLSPVGGTGLAHDRVVFVGTPTAERVAWLRELAGLRPLVFGTRWPVIQGVDIRPPIRRRQLAEVIGEARWNLNLLRPQNARSHNMRSFEVPGAGGNQVAPATGDHRRLLGRDPRTVTFVTRGELGDVLRSDPSELPLRPPDLLVGQTYRDRVIRLLDEVRRL